MNNRYFLPLAIAVAASSLLSGCHIYNKFEMPRTSGLTAEYADAIAEQPDTAAFGNLQWRQVFTDPLLVDLIDRALERNVSLENARLNIDVAHANMLGARLSYLPSLALTPNAAAASYAGSDFSKTYTIPLTASWEVDIFGKTLNRKRGAEAAYRQAGDYAQAVRSQLIAGVANCYYAIATLKAQLNLSRATAELWAETVRNMADLKEAGRVNEAAVVQSRANYLNVLASVTDLEAQLNEAYNTLSLLLNEMPQEWAVSPDAVLPLPPIASQGVAIRELAARPDVRAAEEALAVAYYATNSARAAFYPGLTISAQGGFTNMLGAFVKNPGDWFVQLAGSLAAPIFSRGQNIANLKAAKAQQQQALNTFEHTLLSAAGEVSNAMTTYSKAVEKQALLAKQVEALQSSVEITKELLFYGTSGTTYLEVITAQQNLLAAQMAQLNTRLAAERAVVNLYQSLGGGR